jgi:hypothetical protein
MLFQAEIQGISLNPRKKPEPAGGDCQQKGSTKRRGKFSLAATRVELGKGLSDDEERKWHQ